MATIASRFVSLIETHSAQLSQGLLESIQSSERTRDLRSRIDAAELKQRAAEVYEHLSEWLLNKTEFDIQLRYRQIGERCVSLGIPESQWVWSIALGRQQIWRLLESEAGAESGFELMSELELLQDLDQFFDQVVYHGTVGFESARQKS